MTTLNYQLAHYTLEHHLIMQLWEHGDRGVDEEKINFLADLSLFDINIRQYPASQICLALLALVRREDPAEEKVGLGIKWMVERNAETMIWLK